MRKSLFVFALPLLLAGCGEQPAGKPVTRIALDGGAGKEIAPAPAPTTATPAANSPCTEVTFEDARLVDCIADPARHTITTMLGNPPYRSFRRFAEAAPDEARRVVFAVNAGMFDADGKPIGYYVKDGKRLKELNRADGPGNFHMKPNGVFFGTAGKWRVMASEDFFRLVGDRPQFGTQSGPMLVAGGKLHPQITDDGPSKLVRNAVGVDAAGKAHFVISQGPISFGKLARYYRDVLKVRDALYLDGSVSALWDPARGREDSPAPLGPMILVETKDQP